MTRPAGHLHPVAPEIADLQYLDARDYRLVVTVDNAGIVTIEHPVGGAGTKAVARRRMVRLAAEIVDEVGPRAVAAELGADDTTPTHLARGVVVVPPAPGVAVLMCRCGRAIDTAQMRRAPLRRQFKAGPSIHRIVCAWCASRGALA